MSKKKMPTNEELEKARFLYDLTINSYSDIAEYNNTIDRKIYNTLTLTATLNPILLGIFYYLSTREEIRIMIINVYIMTLVVVGIAFFFIGTIVGIMLYKTWTFKFLDPSIFVKRHKKDKLLDIAKISVATIADITRKNKDVVNAKAKIYQRMLFFIIIGSIFFLLGFVTLALNFIVPYIADIICSIC